MGANNRYKCSIVETLVTYADDFNNDGKKDPVIQGLLKGKQTLRIQEMN
ncbi:hypothetical protein BH10BAC3_BH10BAC3_30450 [soil metagenome]